MYQISPYTLSENLAEHPIKEWEQSFCKFWGSKKANNVKIYSISLMINVNVCIHDFDDAKEESNKAASSDKHLLQE